jgi:hypothetical protein
MKTDSWTSLSDALATVQKITGNEETAKSQLLQKLKWNEVHARSESSVRHFLWARQQGGYRVETDTFPPLTTILSDWWSACEVDWHNNTAHLRWSPYDYKRATEAEARHGRQANPFQFLISGVHVATADLLRLWPPAPPPAPTQKAKPHRPKGTGKHKQDAPFVEKMRALISNGMASSPTQAARLVLEKSGGGSAGTFDSNVRRLVDRYKETHGG